MIRAHGHILFVSAFGTLLAAKECCAVACASTFSRLRMARYFILSGPLKGMPAFILSQVQSTSSVGPSSLVVNFEVLLLEHSWSTSWRAPLQDLLLRIYRLCCQWRPQQ